MPAADRIGETARARQAADRMARRVRARLADDLERACSDAGITHSALAAAAGAAPSHISRILAGRTAASLEMYARLAVPLGLDLAGRLYPNTGPIIRDHLQGRILEGILAQRHPRWDPYTEVGVRVPARGSIDLALHDSRERMIVASEIQSELRRLEQLIRWSTEKALSLPSWDGWSALGDAPAISRLLLVRRTRATREVAATYPTQLRVAYPAHPDDAIASLLGTRPWPGPALVWVVLDAGRVRLLSGR